MLLPAAQHLARIPTANKMKELVKRLLYNHRRMIVLANQRQLQAGRRADGSTITPPYANLTRRLKAQAGQPTDRVTLKDKGDYYADMRLELGADAFTIEDDDVKASDLAEKYGDAIQGIDDENVNRLNRVLRPELKKEVQVYIQSNQ